MFPIHSVNPELHDKMTKIRGSWDNSVESILRAKALGIYVVPVIVLTKINFKEIKDTLLFLDKLGLNRISINRYNLGGAGINNKDISLTHASLKRLSEL